MEDDWDAADEGDEGSESEGDVKRSIIEEEEESVDMEISSLVG